MVGIATVSLTYSRVGEKRRVKGPVPQTDAPPLPRAFPASLLTDSNRRRMMYSITGVRYMLSCRTDTSTAEGGRRPTGELCRAGSLAGPGAVEAGQIVVLAPCSVRDVRWRLARYEMALPRCSSAPPNHSASSRHSCATATATSAPVLGAFFLDSVDVFALHLGAPPFLATSSPGTDGIVLSRRLYIRLLSINHTTGQSQHVS